MPLNSTKIGIDESGKGDYFGPLVVAGVYSSQHTQQILKDVSIQDSKKLTDNKVRSLYQKIQTIPALEYNVVVIGPTRYNDLYNKIKNLNRLLAWGHARVIENLLEKVACQNVLSDKFGDEKYIQQALLSKGRTIHLEQKVRAESDITVAAASIVARAVFLQQIDRLAETYQMSIQKGASKLVVECGRAFVCKHSPEKLKNVAKVHFKTTQQILQNR